MISKVSDERNPGFRIYVLGAGFSRAAGLPLATELFAAVRARIEAQYGTNTKFDRDLHDYIDYCNDCGVQGQSKDALDLEMFMSYLDIEHYLRLRGGDTWSEEGNESQLMIRKAIGAVIHDRTPLPDQLPDCFYRFAEQLSPHDLILTFNYDLIVESALTQVGKSFRRFPYRYKSVNQHGGVIDSEVEEVVLLKLHGSLDWFDDRYFLDLRNSLQAKGSTPLSLHSVFDNPAKYDARPLVDGILPEGDPLRHIHAIRNVRDYYYNDGGFNAPFILSPSHIKFVYAEPLLSFWSGMGRGGAYNLGVSVIGFSMPHHDEYIRIGLYQMLSNYASWWDSPMLNVLKDYVRFVDFRTSQKDVDAYLERYKFANPERSRFFFGGFGADAIDFLFHQHRQS